MSTLMAHAGAELMTREEVSLVATPEGTDTHRPVPHIDVINGVIETLDFRHIAVVKDEYAVSKDGAKMFGVMDLSLPFDGCRLSLGVRNAHDKSMRLALTVGYRVFVCDNMAFSGDFTPVLAKHTKKFNLLQAVSVGIDQMQRNFQPMVNQVDAWRANRLTDDQARLIIYKAFVEGELGGGQRHLDRLVHQHYFDPQYEEFQARTLWSLQNAFTSAFKELEPLARFKATAGLGEFFPKRLMGDIEEAEVLSVN